jgi:hypothetical protein
MRSLNVLGVETVRGFRTVELFEGDLTALDFSADILVLSAYAGSYAPVSGSLIESLQISLGLRVADLARQPALDLRVALGTWVSRQLDAASPFGRVLAIEMRGTLRPLGEALDNVFASLMLLSAKGVRTHVVALPLLGAGSQRLEPEHIAEQLVSRAKIYLDQAPHTGRLVFVERDPSRAEKVANAMDRVLGRHKVNLPQEQLVAALRQDVLHRLQHASTLFAPDCLEVRDDWLRLLQQKEIRAAEFGVGGRKFVELMLGRLGVPQQKLYERIRALEKLGTVSPWICAYMHVLRHLGNEMAHSSAMDSVRQPPTIAPADLTAGMFCLERLLDFWQAYSSPPAVA